MTVRKTCRIFIVAAIILTSLFCTRPVTAEGSYRIVIEDSADLLSNKEEQALRLKMQEILPSIH